MNAFSRFLVMVAVCLLASRTALAMDIQQFESMVEEDQQAYITDLVWGAAIVLEQDCKPQVAAQVRKLFIHDIGASDREKFNVLEGTQSLGDKLVAAGNRVAEHPEQASRIRVDDLLRATLRDKGITLPDGFAAIDRAFKPKTPPSARKPADDAGFGSNTRGATGVYIAAITINLLQTALDLRSTSEIAADTRMKGVCKDAEPLFSEGGTLLKSGKKTEAAAAFQGACEKGLPAGCGVLGALTDEGTGVAKNPVRAAELYRQGCDGGYRVSCYALGFDYANGIGVTKDPARAAALYQQACDLGYLDGCNNLGLMYEAGTGVAKDFGRARSLYEKACDGDDFSGCTDLGVMYMRGTGVTEDRNRAAALYQKACDGKNAVGCFNLGLMYEYGSAVTKDAIRAGGLYRQACDGGNADACRKLDAKAVASAGRAAPPADDGTPSVAAYQPSWIGRTMKVRGTVSRFVQKSVNGEPYVYLYFTERPDSTVVACTRDDRWLLGVLGVDDFRSVVGKTLEFNLEVVSQPCTEGPGASLWIWQRNQARLVGGSSR